MTTFYIGEKHAYRDEVTLARAESARNAVHAPHAETLDWDARLIFMIRHEGETRYMTDSVDVQSFVAKHPSCDVRVIAVH